ncbi:MAG: hypothetical protein HRU70_06960 [Phycisphaeraceae bacterium]|nr:MAG: hypothetical protein HRU70_06960 [Phycisphaeraceae bacterium]
MLQRVPMLIVVTLISATVWLFAESESLREKEISLPIEFASEPGSSLLLEVSDGQNWRDRALVSVRGSTSALSALEEQAKRAIRLTPDREGMPSLSGETLLDLRDVLTRTPEIGGRGLRITRIEPSAIRVWIDEQVTKELEVVVDAGSADLDGVPRPSVTRARLRMPKSQERILRADARVTARVAPESLTALVPGRKETLTGVRLLPPIELSGLPARHIRVEPSSASVELTLRNRTAQHTLQQVYIQVSLPPRDVGQWDVKIENDRAFFENVVATGPAELIGELKAGRMSAVALLQLSYEELNRRESAVRPVFMTIPPSSLVFTVDNPIVKVSATRRAEPAGGPRDDAEPGL